MRTFQIAEGGSPLVIKIKADYFLLDPSGALLFSRDEGIAGCLVVQCYALGKWERFWEVEEEPARTVSN